MTRHGGRGNLSARPLFRENWANAYRLSEVPPLPREIDDEDDDMIDRSIR